MRRERHMRALHIAVLTMALVLSPLLAATDGSAVRRVGVSTADRYLRITFGFRDAFTPAVIKKLSSGLTTNVLIQLRLERQGEPVPVAYFARTVEVTYDLWEEKFIVTREDASGRRRAGVTTRKRAIELAGVLFNAPLIDLGGIPADMYRVRARIETNPVSKEMVDKIRHWLAKSQASKGGAPAPSNYFGSFVGALVDRRISRADHQINFVSQWFRLDPK
jgi:hypothetical protein